MDTEFDFLLLFLLNSSWEHLTQQQLLFKIFICYNYNTRSGENKLGVVFNQWFFLFFTLCRHDSNSPKKPQFHFHLVYLESRWKYRIIVNIRASLGVSWAVGNVRHHLTLELIFRESGHLFGTDLTPDSMAAIKHCHLLEFIMLKWKKPGIVEWLILISVMHRLPIAIIIHQCRHKGSRGFSI